MSDQEKEYFLKRAETELHRAQHSGDPNAVAAHYRLAELYLDRVYGGNGEVGGK